MIERRDSVPCTAEIGADRRSLRHAFEERVVRDPAAIAVVAGPIAWSYGELNARANQLARALRSRGIGPNDVVAFACDRGASTIATLLAIVKTGGIYLPLDSSYPLERMQFMVRDSAARAVISTATNTQRLIEADLATPVLDLDALGLQSYSAQDEPADGGASELAYIMYTSGTTGRPKGVEITQRAIANLIAAPELRIEHDDVVAQFANISFDAATYEIWGALLGGARLAIADRETLLDPDALAAWVRSAGVSVAFVTSALLRHIIRQTPAAFAPLRRLIAGGDVVDPQTVERIFAHGPPQTLLNGYGPTETTTFATTFAITPSTRVPIPIGRPLPNVETHILDDFGRPVPAGTAGQLFIGGAGLARGYVNDSELTARRFIPHPLNSTRGARLYATGDFARYGPDGAIDYLGRADRQIKVRGFRIEIGEIEAALLAEPGVIEAAVTLVEAEDGEKRILAYVVEDRPAAREPAAMRRALARRLPEYMLPNSIVAVARIPLTPNGKVDLAVLTASAAPAPVPLSDNDVAGRPYEREVAAIFADVLGVPTVARSVGFFALGGHSLLATRVLSRLRERFGVDLTLREFFTEPTVAALARRIGRAPLASRVALTGPRIEAGRTIPLSAAQERLWLLAQLEPDSSAYNVFNAFAIRGHLDQAALERAINGIVRRHDVLRSTIAEVNGGPAYLIDDGYEFGLPTVAASSPAELDALLLDERERPFDLRSDVPLRALLLRRATDDHVLLVTIHHIATDGWSMGIFKRELGAFYAADAPLSLSALPASYADFARSPATGDDERLWADALADAPPALEFGSTSSIGAISIDATGRLRSRPLTAATRAALRSHCRVRGTTEYALLFAAFAMLLHDVTGRRDFFVATAVANRTQSTFERLIGFFVNTLPIRVRIAEGTTVGEFLANMERTILTAFDGGHVPFQTLVARANPTRTRARTPLANVMFVLQNAPDDPLVLNGLDVTPIPLERTVAKFDLMLEITIGADGALETAFEYRTALFDAGAIDDLLARYDRYVAAILEDPSEPVARLTGTKTTSPEPRRDRRPATNAAPAPTPTPTSTNGPDREAQLAMTAVWERVLGVAPIGIDDNFFELGGHSLLAARLIGEIERTFHVRPPLSLLFERPTIGAFARGLVEILDRVDGDPIVTYNAAGTARPMFYLHGSIDGGGFYCRALADALGANRPLITLRPSGGGNDHLASSIEAIATECIARIKHIAPHGPYLLGGYCAGGLIAFEMARRLRAAGDDVTQLVLVDVPGAPQTMRRIVDAVDRSGALLRADEQGRLRVMGLVARLPHHRARFAASHRKIDFLLSRFRRSRIEADPCGDPANENQQRLLQWKRLVEAYVPRAYDGPIRLLFAESSDPARAGWSSISPAVAIDTIAGTHFTCITEHLPQTAAAFADALRDVP